MSGKSILAGSLAPLIAFAGLLALTLAHPARADDESFEAMQLADDYATKVVNKEFEGGADLEAKIITYAHSTTLKAWRFKLDISFKGQLSGDQYECKGTLDVTPDGYKWTTTWMNDKLTKYELAKGLTQAIIDEMNKENKK